jgi:peptide/nickel transport system permease protein
MVMTAASSNPRFRRFEAVAKAFGRERMALVSLFVLLVVVLGALTAGIVSPYDPDLQDYAVISRPPSAQHLLGTDDLGRDILSRVIYGSRVSIQVGTIAILIAVLVGMPIGLFSGLMGGKTDGAIMRVIDALQAFPSLLLALALAAALGPSKTSAMIAIGIVEIPVFARLTRGQTLSIKELDYIAAARVLGYRTWRILFRHILPNASGPIVVQATLGIAWAIIAESSLSFLGVGVQPPTASWGYMLKMGMKYLSSAPWMSLSPGLAIFTTVLAVNFIGDGLRHALDPLLALRRRG